jgi:hypothetical protein
MIWRKNRITSIEKVPRATETVAFVARGLCCIDESMGIGRIRNFLIQAERVLTSQEVLRFSPVCSLACFGMREFSLEAASHALPLAE